MPHHEQGVRVSLERGFIGLFFLNYLSVLQPSALAEGEVPGPATKKPLTVVL
jgi:hypothetical protein